ncbi:MAG: ribonuclease D [Thermoanaerobaculia bacterium]
MVLTSILSANPRRVALDVEGDSFYRFGERLCLVQLAFSGSIHVLDPLETDLGPLFSDLESRELVLHGADFDLRLLHARYGFHPSHVFDTMLAARFLNFPKFGLSDLSERFFGIVLEKKHQRADWCSRPLSAELVDYAKRDVERLEELGDRLREELVALGRLEWHREECDAVILRTVRSAARPADPEPWRVKGSGSLGRKELAFLKELALARDRMARESDRALFRIFSAEDLIRLTKLATADPESALRKFPRGLPGAHLREFGSAIRAAQTAQPEEWPEPPAPGRRPEPRLEKRVRELTSRRDQAAASLNLEPSFLASRGAIARVAESRPRDEEELAGSLESGWRAKILAASFLTD